VASGHLAEYLVKGFVMDDDRLKNPGGWDYFDELLARIREIRASEKRFYQKVRDLFALSADYQADDQNAHIFFAEVQNKIEARYAKATGVAELTEQSVESYSVHAHTGRCISLALSDLDAALRCIVHARKGNKCALPIIDGYANRPLVTHRRFFRGVRHHFLNAFQ